MQIKNIPTGEESGRDIAMLPVASTQDVVSARFVGREEAVRLGYSPRAVTQIATAISEIVRNVVQHSGSRGRIVISETTDKSGRNGLRVCVEDSGKGIPDLDQKLASLTPGCGLNGSKKLMDEFCIRSHAGQGTTVTMVKWRQVEKA